MSHSQDSLYRANAAALLVDPKTKKILLVKAKTWDVTEYDTPKGGVEL